MGTDVRLGEGSRSDKVGRQMQLPWGKAVEISFKSLRVRFGRSMLTVSSIILAIAFLMYVWGSGRFENAIAVGYLPDKEKIDQLNRQMEEVWRPFEQELETAFAKLKSAFMDGRKDLAQGSIGKLYQTIEKEHDLTQRRLPSQLVFATFPTASEDKLKALEEGAKAIGIRYNYDRWSQGLRDMSGIKLLTLKADIQARVTRYNNVELALQRSSSGEGSGAVQPTASKGSLGATSLWLIAISLLVCAVGIVNAMLMSVSERFREIGTMKCLGALDSFIVRLFILESFFQGFTGTLLGILLGFLFALVVNARVFGWMAFTYFPTGGVLLTALYSAVVGAVLSVVAAVFPALRAARMAPVEAMRIEE